MPSTVGQRLCSYPNWQSQVARRCAVRLVIVDDSRPQKTISTRCLLVSACGADCHLELRKQECANDTKFRPSRRPTRSSRRHRSILSSSRSSRHRRGSFSPKIMDTNAMFFYNKLVRIMVESMIKKHRVRIH